MTPADSIRPADVYSLVSHLYTLVLVLCGLVIVQIVVKGLLFRKILNVLWRVEKLLNVAEVHANIFDRRSEGVENYLAQIQKEARSTAQVAAVAAKAAAADVKLEVAKVPEKTVERLKSQPDSGLISKEGRS